ncbi:MAG: SDR family oxidoreductase [Betaproteobacteria bacterium]|nr:SDR family oxidoreductase [Betaproteobacteria bacterium]
MACSPEPCWVTRCCSIVARRGRPWPWKTDAVTGAASGFGAAIAERMARAGATVMLADLNLAGAQAQAQRIADGGLQAQAIACDVSRADDFKSLVEHTRARMGGLHVLVNNAGTTHRNKPSLEVTEAEFDRVWQVNVKSLYWSVQSVMPHFIQQGSGAMINVASTTGVRPGPGLVWYSGTKAAMINLTRGLALEHARFGIRVNAVNPMIGETAMLEQFMGMPDTPQNRERFLSRIPLGRFTRPNDVASAVTFLASDEADYLTGVCLDVDGGRNI